MAYLIGSADTTRFSSTHGFQSVAGNRIHFNGNDTQGITPAQNGTADTLSLYISSWGSLNNIKACLYDDNVLVESVVINSSVGTGLVDIPLAGTTSLDTGSAYRLGIYTDSLNDITMFTDTGALTLRYGTLGSYAAPEDPLPSGSYDSFNEFYWAIEETSAGLTLDSTPADINSQTQETFTVSNASTTPTALNTVVKFDDVNGEAATVNSVVDNLDGSYDINVTWPRVAAKKFDGAIGYPVYIEIGDSAPSPTLLFEDDFSTYTSLSDTLVSNGGKWDELDNNNVGQMAIETYPADAGKKSLMIEYVNAEDLDTLKVNMPASKRHLFFQWKEYRSSTFDFGPSKDVRFTSNGASGLADYYFLIGRGAATAAQDDSEHFSFNNQGATEPSPVSDPNVYDQTAFVMSRATEYKIEIEFKLNTDTNSDGEYRMWLDDVLTVELTGMKFLPDGQGAYDLDNFQLGMVASNNAQAFNGVSKIWRTDVKIAESRIA